ncbi:MAG: M48 family metallopeptidase [Candidatus Marsarchaeota archaeon]|jgi:predicted metal-dependent hydrolase|nr:M48 family metallopeptidase [Candidatus Marsarchaeota archaeon]
MHSIDLQIFEEEEIEISNNKYKFIKAYSKLSSARAIIDNDKIIVKFPYHYNIVQINNAYSNLKKRVIKVLEKNPEHFKKESLDFSKGKICTIINKEIFIIANEADYKKPSAAYYNNTIVLKIPKDLSEQQKEFHIKLLLRKIISKIFKEDLKKRVDELNKEYFNSKINKIIIRNNSSNWGTYNRRTSNIGINFKLLFAPLSILDSVIVHELAHTKVLNHQKKFWDIVYEIIPDYKERRKWLMQNKHNLLNGDLKYL